MAYLNIVLSQKGQKDSLRKGGSGTEKQSMTISAPGVVMDLAKAAGFAVTVESNGTMSLTDRGFSSSLNYAASKWIDIAPQDEAELLTYLGQAVEKKQARDAAGAATKIAEEKERVERLVARITATNATETAALVSSGINASLKTYNSAFGEIPWDAPELASKKAEADALAAARRLSAATEQAAEQAKTNALAAEQAAWIAEHGTARLKKAAAIGYKHDLLYAQERRDLEFPGADIDGIDGSWAEMKGPSEEALDREAKLRGHGYDASIIWLKSDGRDDYQHEGDAFAPHETILIENYLDGWTLILPE